ncbi:hypothetical protein [Antribacter gilvus]|uniref:hypothetical protein n=1 Tax=Antribacter gilvus TaxID=2304675 RepID=UPI000F794B4C|nr:hypothetical protein [Antribacter gilvus]
MSEQTWTRQALEKAIREQHTDGAAWNHETLADAILSGPPAPQPIAPGTVGTATWVTVEGVVPMDEVVEGFVADGTAEERDRLGEAAFAAIRTAGAHHDGAQTWQAYFRPMTFPAWDVAVSNAVKAVRRDVRLAEDQSDRWQERAKAAEARLASILALLDNPGPDVSCADRNLTTPGCFAVDLASRIRALAGPETTGAGQ